MVIFVAILKGFTSSETTRLSNSNLLICFLIFSLEVFSKTASRSDTSEPVLQFIVGASFYKMKQEATDHSLLCNTYVT